LQVVVNEVPLQTVNDHDLCYAEWVIDQLLSAGYTNVTRQEFVVSQCKNFTHHTHVAGVNLSATLSPSISQIGSFELLEDNILSASFTLNDNTIVFDFTLVGQSAILYIQCLNPD
jgi:hypothetical protein